MTSGKRRKKRKTYSHSSERVVVSDFFTPQRLAALCVLFVVTAIALLYLWVSWQAVDWLNEKQAAEIELQRLENERERLRFEVSQAFSLNRIERIATSQPLYMTRPTTDDGSLNYINLNDDDTED